MQKEGSTVSNSTYICIHLSSCYAACILCENKLHCEHDSSLHSECFDCITVLVLKFTADVQDLVGLYLTFLGP